MKPFLDADLVDQSRNVDSRCYELFLALSNQPLLLKYVEKRELRPMHVAMPGTGRLSVA